MTIQEQIKQIIALKNITPYRISKDTGISESQFSRFLSNQVNLSLNKFIQLVEYLDCEIKIVEK